MTHRRLVCALGLACALNACHGADQGASTESPEKSTEKTPKDQVVLSPAEQTTAQIETQPATINEAPAVLRVSGRITRADDRTWRVGVRSEGIVMTIHANLGAVVRKGEVLARYHADEVREERAKYRRATAELRRAEATAAQAQRNYARMETLLGLKAASSMQVEQARQDLMAADTSVKNAEIEVDRGKDLLEDDLRVPADAQPGNEEAGEVPIIAPAAGYVLEKNVTPGRTIAPGQDAFVIGDLSEVWMLAAIRQEELAQLHVGQSVSVTAPGSDERMKGTITNLGQELDPTTRVMPVRITLKNPSGRLRPEMLVNAEIPVGAAKPTLMVPSDAVQQINGQDVVFVRTTSDHFVVRAVRVGRTTDATTPVLEGLTEVRSLSKLGLSMVTVVFDDSVAMYFARQLVSERLQQVSRQLPQGVQPSLGLPATAFGELYQYTLSGPLGPMALKDVQDWVIKGQLRTIPGVSEINSWGGQSKQYQIVVDPIRLAQYGLDLHDVATRVQQNNTNFGGGYIEHASEQYTLRGTGRAQTSEDFGDVVLTSKNGTPVLVRDVATVRIGPAPPEGATLRNGETVSGMVIMLKGENGKQLIERVKARIASLRLPPGVTIVPFYDQAFVIDGTIHTVETNLFEGFILVTIQSSAAQAGRPAFEVASVKPVTSREVLIQRGLACGFTNGGFIGFGPLRWLIACAYGIPAARDHQDIVGGPNWLDNDLFDIAANLATDDVPRVGSLNQQQIDEYRRRRLLMLQTLLADRFKLAVYRETKEAPMYALVIARRDGRLGPKLHPTAGDCAAWIADGRRGAPPGSRPGPPPAAGDLPCGRQMVNGFAIRGSAMTLARLADMLSPRVERPVQERTGLAGNFDLDLQWRPEPGKEGPLDASLSDSLPTSIFTALQEQLGLKLESTKGSADVLVIDHVEQPTPN